LGVRTGYTAFSMNHASLREITPFTRDHYITDFLFNNSVFTRSIIHGLYNFEPSIEEPILKRVLYKTNVIWLG
jgi:hypothetical protein